MGYDYEPEALTALAGHGLAPRTQTEPARTREALSDLYRYEIRRLKQRFVAGQIAKADYAPQVIALRRRYWLLSVPIHLWAKPHDWRMKTGE
ncbi:MAG: hypothetical protein ABIQ52_13075 [Vicinamibacterales bacterium]